MKRANGDGSIIKLSGKRRRPYAVRITAGWTEEGKQILKYLGYYTTKTEAKAALREYLVDPFDLSGNKTTLKEVYDIWEKTATLSETTMKNYASAFRKCEILYSKPIRDIKVSQIELIMKDATTSTQPMIRNVLNQVYIAAEKNGIIDKNIIPHDGLFFAGFQIQNGQFSAPLIDVQLFIGSHMEIGFHRIQIPVVDGFQSMVQFQNLAALAVAEENTVSQHLGTDKFPEIQFGLCRNLTGIQINQAKLRG